MPGEGHVVARQKSGHRVKEVNIMKLHITVKVVIFARSYFRDLPIFNCFACF